MACGLGFSQQTIDGTWQLVAKSSYRGPGFFATLVITQVGASITGSMTVPGGSCAASDNFSGSVGATISIQVSDSKQRIVLTGSSVNASQMSGTYTSKFLIASCNPLNGDGDAGTWTATRNASITGVLTATAFGGFTSVAPGSWIEIYGSDLATNTRSWTKTDFSGLGGTAAPTSLDGTFVTIGGQSAFVDYISPSQVNAQIPSGVGIGSQSVSVTTPTGTRSSYSVTVNPEQPGLLAPPSFKVGGMQYVVALYSDGATFVLPPGLIPGVPARRAIVGDVITLYGVGFGSVTPNHPAGQVVQLPNKLVAPFRFLFGQTEATLTYAGLAPGAVGLYQFNVVVPNVSSGDAIPLSFTLAGVPGAQGLYIAVQ
jgi:uncharacterized protein (TIGR03437 family)